MDLRTNKRIFDFFLCTYGKFSNLETYETQSKSQQIQEKLNDNRNPMRPPQNKAENRQQKQ